MTLQSTIIQWLTRLYQAGCGRCNSYSWYGKETTIYSTTAITDNKFSVVKVNHIFTDALKCLATGHGMSHWYSYSQKVTETTYTIKSLTQTRLHLRRWLLQGGLQARLYNVGSWRN